MICDIAFVILWEIPEKKGFRCLKTLYKHRWTLFAEEASRHCLRFETSTSSNFVRNTFSFTVTDRHKCEPNILVFYLNNYVRFTNQ